MIEDRLREVRLDEPALLLDLDALVARAARHRRALRLAVTLAVLVTLATLSTLWP
ncbi:hypothetical protein [Actinophytocola gossypii]|uniref:DUF3040 domain-containing protein n=1 Tax=Actinophytocola gossypii TaxID=2812003 RepID=A0ABT2JDP5_9PSEU|nr:hypothetical protein [Actinophytocola gossypii]MCT2585990.1 hypothetical protein [Actinophytocola gossypii]